VIAGQAHRGIFRAHLDGRFEVQQAGKLLNYVPGFRSRRAWKSIIAAIYYLMLLPLLIVDTKAFLMFACIPFITFNMIDVFRQRHLLPQAIREAGESRSTINRCLIPAVVLMWVCLISLMGLVAKSDREEASATQGRSAAKLVSNESPVASTRPLVGLKTENRKKEAAPTRNLPAEKMVPHKASVDATEKLIGLGATYQSWEEHFGSPNRVFSKMKDGYGKFCFQDDLYWGVQFLNGRARCMTLQIEKQNRDGITLEQARRQAQVLLPPDAKFVRKYMPYAKSDTPSNEIVEVFRSKTVERVFHGVEDIWFKSIPPRYYDKTNPKQLEGDIVERDMFVVIYQRFNSGFNNNNVFGVMVATGNDP
jgi:hypothetical protein